MLNLQFVPFPELTTEGLVLRQLKIEDEDQLLILRSNEQVAQFLDRPLMKTLEEVRQFIHKIQDGIDRSEAILWAIASKDNPRLIGAICLWKISQENACADIGYELMPAYQGRRIMQEAIPKVIEYGFERMQLRTILADVRPDNIKSIKLLEKNGFSWLSAGFPGDGDNPGTVIYSLENKGNKN